MLKETHYSLNIFRFYRFRTYYLSVFPMSRRTFFPFWIFLVFLEEVSNIPFQHDKE